MGRATVNLDWDLMTGGKKKKPQKTLPLVFAVKKEFDEKDVLRSCDLV